MAQQHGSLTNLLFSGMKGCPAPEVGMGATILHWSDRSPATITKVYASGKMIEIKRDKYTRIDKNGMSDSQTYEYETNHDAPAEIYKLDKKGRWREVEENEKGRLVFCGSGSLMIGSRQKYYDYSF